MVVDEYVLLLVVYYIVWDDGLWWVFFIDFI